MKMEHSEVDKLYSSLGLQNSNKKLRNNINCGDMNRKLNSDFSSVLGNKGCMTFSSSTGSFKK